jgi:hypothetical protein
MDARHRAAQASLCVQGCADDQLQQLAFALPRLDARGGPPLKVNDRSL